MKKMINYNNINHFGIVPNKFTNTMDVNAYHNDNTSTVITSLPGNSLETLDYAMNIAYTLGTNGLAPVYYRGFLIK